MKNIKTKKIVIHIISCLEIQTPAKVSRVNNELISGMGNYNC